MERKPSKKTNMSVQSNIISTKNRYDSFNLKQKKVLKATKVKQFWPNPSEKSRPWRKPTICCKKKGNHSSTDCKRGNHTHSHESKVKDSLNRGKTVIIGDSQLHRIEETELSNRYVKTLVRSKGGLKIKDVNNKYQSILEEDVQEVIFHVGVNNVQTDNEEIILRKYQELGESVQVERVCFSSIIKRDERPELNLKIMDISKTLKKCLEKDYDFVDNSNIGFHHLAEDKLHINKNGQRILTRNFLIILKIEALMPVVK